MAINVKKYTKDQMAKMVEEVQEKTAALEAEITELKNCIDKKNALLAEYANLKAAMQRKNAALTEQISQMNGEAINRANEIANLKADADVLRAQLKNANDTMEAVSKELQRVNSENDVLRNKLAESEEELSKHRAATVKRLDELKVQLDDTEAALGRANAELGAAEGALVERLKMFTLMRNSRYNAEQRANYAEAHPWRNLWAWVKRKLVRHE